MSIKTGSTFAYHCKPSIGKVDPLTIGGLGALIPHVAENLCITF